jgi:hypothetical protein
LLTQANPDKPRKKSRQKSKSFAQILFGTDSYKDLITKSPAERRKEKPKPPQEAAKEKAKKSKKPDLRTLLRTK